MAKDQSTQDELQNRLEEATFEYTLGNAEKAVDLLDQVVAVAPDYFEAWHALAEVYHSQKRFKDALAAAERAHAINPDDLHLNTSLSRIWVAMGNKDKAEEFAARARVLGWKEQLKEPPPKDLG